MTSMVHGSWRSRRYLGDEESTGKFAIHAGRAKVDLQMMRQTSVKLGWTAWLVMIGAGAMLDGCGYTDLEMAAKQRQIDALVTEVSALKAGQRAACKTSDKPQERGASGPALSSR
jgi:hypothetical protein